MLSSPPSARRFNAGLPLCGGLLATKLNREEGGASASLGICSGNAPKEGSSMGGSKGFSKGGGVFIKGPTEARFRVPEPGAMVASNGFAEVRARGDGRPPLARGG